MYVLILVLDLTWSIYDELSNISDGIKADISSPNVKKTRFTSQKRMHVKYKKKIDMQDND